MSPTPLGAVSTIRSVNVIRLRDKARLERFLRKQVDLQLYALGDFVRRAARPILRAPQPYGENSARLAEGQPQRSQRAQR